MAFVTIVVMLALTQYMYFSISVGRARARHDISAPAISGDEVFERFFRAHQNTLEQLVIFVPAIYAAGYFAHSIAAALVGVVFLVGRMVYFRQYVTAPESRGLGMFITFGANLILVAMALVMATRAALAG